MVKKTIQFLFRTKNRRCSGNKNQNCMSTRCKLHLWLTAKTGMTSILKSQWITRDHMLSTISVSLGTFIFLRKYILLLVKQPASLNWQQGMRMTSPKKKALFQWCVVRLKTVSHANTTSHWVVKSNEENTVRLYWYTDICERKDPLNLLLGSPLDCLNYGIMLLLHSNNFHVNFDLVAMFKLLHVYIQ